MASHQFEPISRIGPKGDNSFDYLDSNFANHRFVLFSGQLNLDITPLYYGDYVLLCANRRWSLRRVGFSQPVESTKVWIDGAARRRLRLDTRKPEKHPIRVVRLPAQIAFPLFWLDFTDYSFQQGATILGGFFAGLLAALVSSVLSIL
jgi:hypothetical protein